ncbi:hypothetical protein F5J12DRAFT_782566 [Pisolithus orientalis]|uniref:uncharacterized protein n=1 Tax=Pisolithus orientalis TaxID=936130 RepID=UPI00222416F9|nr:uncharacterized protein F5J12DRAFT_782566 [Pisolithus orientalis]KAI6007519.1 hypothetical protein F5J12DRAFT_782566 [Pisolithus orientalis]
MFWEPKAREATTRRAGDWPRMLPGGSAGWDKAKLSLGVIGQAGQGFLETVKAEASVSGGWSCTLELGQGNMQARNDQGKLEAEDVQGTSNVQQMYQGWVTRTGGQVGAGKARGLVWEYWFGQKCAGGNNETEDRGQSQSLRLRMAETEAQCLGQPKLEAKTESSQSRTAGGRLGAREDWKGQLETGLELDRAVRLERRTGDWPEVSQGQRGYLGAGLKVLGRVGVAGGDLRCYLAGGLIMGGQNSVGKWANTETRVTMGSKVEV